jgi:acyl-CoA reductase-like NAD-dependent aldehyde dehydrogenase
MSATMTGTMTGTQTRRLVEIHSPHDGTVIDTLACATDHEVGEAVERALEAQALWAARSLADRIDVVVEAARRLGEAAAELAALQEREMGQPAELGVAFITGTAQEWRAMADQASAYPFVDELAGTGAWQVSNLKEPLGVVAAITPWNFPVPVAAGAIAPALLAGNAVVLKPSERAFRSVAHMAEVLDLPDGVLTVLLGDGETGAALAGHPQVALVLHTGSVRTGRAIAAQVGARGARVGLELGGKDPVVIDADVPPEWAAEVVANGAFLNTGQICVSMERIYVHRAIADRFLTALVEQATSMNLSLGPLVDATQRDLVHAQVTAALGQGARALVGGEIPAGPGCFYPATVLVDVGDDMQVMTEETFGPVAPVRVVDTFEEGMALARSSDYGLAATLLTGTPAHAELASTLPAGIVWVNEWQGGAAGMVYEPAGCSGHGKVGASASFDQVTRAMVVAMAPPPWAGPEASTRST